MVVPSTLRVIDRNAGEDVPWPTEAEISSDAVAATVSFTPEPGTSRGSGTVVVTAATGAPHSEFGVVLRGTPIDYEPDDVIEVVAVEVYDLTVDVVPDTITIVPGRTLSAGMLDDSTDGAEPTATSAREGTPGAEAPFRKVGSNPQPSP